MINKEVIYDQIRLALDVADFRDEDIRYSVLGEEFDSDANHVVFNFSLKQKIPADLQSLMFILDYSINVVVLSNDVGLITASQDKIRNQLRDHFISYNFESVGDTDIVKDNELEIFNAESQFGVTFN